MYAINLIISRRSIRKFKEKPVHENLIQQLLKAGMYAPSARNTRAWHFIVISDKNILLKISEVHPYAKMLKSAPLAILVCGDSKEERTLQYLIQNCAAATQNILLAAKSLELGSVWLGIQPREDRIVNMRKIIGLPEHVVPISLIAIGYADEEPETPNRFDPSRIKYDKWS